jgi:hypothetical protein
MLDRLPDWMKEAALRSQLPAWMQDPPPKREVSDATRVGPPKVHLPKSPVLSLPNAPISPEMARRIKVGDNRRGVRSALEAGQNLPSVVGDVSSGLTAVLDVLEGDYAGAALNSVGMLPFIAGAGSIKKVGKRAAKNTGKAALAGVDFRSVSPEEALEMARRGEHLRQMPDGQYVGAPAGTNSGAQLGARRRSFDELVEGGEKGLDWYPRARGAVEEMAGPDVAKQQMTARSLGNFSSQANPETNLGFHLQAHNAYEAGAPRKIVRTGIQAKKYNQARDTGTKIKLGPKQEPYVNKFDPTQDPNHIPTNDIWHGRSWGFKNPDGSPWSSGYSGSQHTWLDGETILAADRANRKKLLGHDTWNASSVQAAPWVYLKGIDLHRKNPKKFPTLQDGVAEAAKSYGDALPKHTAFGTHEQIPGAGTDHLPGLLESPMDERAAFSNDPRSLWSDESGRDVLYDAAGLHQRTVNDASGYFTPAGGTPEINPAKASRPLVALSKDAGGATVDPIDQSMLNKVEGTRAYLDAQNMGAWHKNVFGDKAKAGASTSVRVQLDRPLNEAEMKQLAGVAEKHGFGVSDTGEGVTLMNFGGGPADGTAVNKALRGELGKELNSLFPGARIERARTVSDAVDFQDALSAGSAGQGKATRQLLGLLDDPVSPATAAKIGGDPRVRAKAAGNAERDAATAGRYGPVREDIQNARRIFAEGGVEGLRRALAQGVPLPVIMAAMGTSGLLFSEGE